MPLGIAPVTFLIVGVVGGLGAAATYGTFHYAEKLGPQLSLSDLRPALPWEGLPFPVFFYTKPEILAEMKRR